MPKYFCDYCDTHLTHDSPSVRKTHCQGRKHKDNVKLYYQTWMEEQAQHLIDATTAAYRAGKITANPFSGTPGVNGVAIPPPGAVLRPPLVVPPVGGPPAFVPRPGMPPGIATNIVVNPLMAVQPPMMPMRPPIVPPAVIQPPPNFTR